MRLYRTTQPAFFFLFVFLLALAGCASSESGSQTNANETKPAKTNSRSNFHHEICNRGEAAFESSEQIKQSGVPIVAKFNIQCDENDSVVYIGERGDTSILHNQTFQVRLFSNSQKIYEFEINRWQMGAAYFPKEKHVGGWLTFEEPKLIDFLPKDSIVVWRCGFRSSGTEDNSTLFGFVSLKTGETKLSYPNHSYANPYSIPSNKSKVSFDANLFDAKTFQIVSISKHKLDAHFISDSLLTIVYRDSAINGINAKLLRMDGVCVGNFESKLRPDMEFDGDGYAQYDKLSDGSEIHLSQNGAYFNRVSNRPPYIERVELKSGKQFSAANASSKIVCKFGVEEVHHYYELYFDEQNRYLGYFNREPSEPFKQNK